MSDVILFGECAGLDFIDNASGFRYFIKNSALLRLSNFIRRRGYSVFQVHHFSSFQPEEIIKLLEKHLTNKTKVIGLSTSFLSATKISKINPYGHYLGTNMFPQFFPQEKTRIIITLKYIKEKFPDVKIVVGGSAIFNSRLKSELDIVRWSFDLIKPYVDYFVQGAGELVFLKIINNELLHVKTFNGFNIINGDQYQIKDFSEVANTPIEKIDCIAPGEGLSTELAHGCIFNCEFCTGRVLGKTKKEFMRTFESFRSEILYNYKTFGTKFYLFLDDIINDNSEKLDWLIKIRNEDLIDLTWVSYTRLDMIKMKNKHNDF